MSASKKAQMSFLNNTGELAMEFDPRCLNVKKLEEQMYKNT